MRFRTLGIGFIAVLALEASLVTASFAVAPPLWLNKSVASGERGVPGEGAFASLELHTGADYCGLFNSGKLLSNGNPVDKLSFKGGETNVCHEFMGEGRSVISGEVKAVQITTVAGNEVMTVTSVIHLLSAPWCTYTLPSSMKFPFRGSDQAQTETAVTVSGRLDPSRSFGACASTHPYEVGFGVLSSVSEFYWAEP